MTTFPNAQNNPAGAIPVYVTRGGVAVSGSTPYFNSALLAAPASIKAASGSLFGLNVSNLNASVEYIQVFDAASVTVGTTAPIQSFAIPASGSLNLSFGEYGIAFSNAIQVAATTTATGAVAPGTGLVVNAQYK